MRCFGLKLVCAALLYCSARAQDAAQSVAQIINATTHGGAGPASRIVNLSTRMTVAPGSPIVTGFAISGKAARPILVRAVGPGLSQFGLTDVLTAPRLELRAADGTLLATNLGWNNEPGLAAAFSQVGGFALAADSRDAAVMMILEPGGYTVNVLAAEGQIGTALAEIYDLGDAASDSQLINASSLSTIPSGGEAVSGFILAGSSPRNFLIRGVGPGLAKFGVPGVLSDPFLTVFDATGRSIAGNGDWSGTVNIQPLLSQIAAAVASGVATPFVPTNTAPTSGGDAAGLQQYSARNEAAVRSASAQTGAFPLDPLSLDAATVVSLAPGAYTVQIKGVSVMVINPVGSAGGSALGAAQAVNFSFEPAAAGVALFELYALER